MKRSETVAMPIRRVPAPGLLLWAAILVLSTAGCATAPQASTAPPAPGDPDWPRFLGPLANGKSTEPGFSTDWPSTGPPVLWSKVVGRGYSAPSIAAGKLFLFDRKDDRARLFCLESETGAELWKAEYTTTYRGTIEEKGGPMASPVVDGERVYTFGAEGRLRCHRVADGELLWDVDTASHFGVVQNLYGAASTPWVEGELLIAIIGGSPPGSDSQTFESLRGNGSGIVAFDKLTGEVLYRLSDELASYASPVVATIAGRRWGFAFTRGGLVGFDPLEGRSKAFFPWKDPQSKGVNASTPVVVGDRVFLTEAYGPGAALLRVRHDRFEVIWKDPPGREKSLAAHWSTPVHHQGYLYGISGRASAEAELRSIELATGKVMWRHPGVNLATVLFAAGHLVVLTEHGRMMVVKANPYRFELIAEVDLGKADGGATGGEAAAEVAHSPRPLLRYPVWSAPVLVRGRLYVRGWSRLVCFDLRPRAVERSR